jgi:hypothetical protein
MHAAHVKKSEEKNKMTGEKRIQKFSRKDVKHKKTILTI